MLENNRVTFSERLFAYYQLFGSFRSKIKYSKQIYHTRHIFWHLKKFFIGIFDLVLWSSTRFFAGYLLLWRYRTYIMDSINNRYQSIQTLISHFSGNKICRLAGILNFNLNFELWSGYLLLSYKNNCCVYQVKQKKFIMKTVKTNLTVILVTPLPKLYSK